MGDTRYQVGEYNRCDECDFAPCRCETAAKPDVNFEKVVDNLVRLVELKEKEIDSLKSQLNEAQQRYHDLESRALKADIREADLTHALGELKAQSGKALSEDDVMRVVEPILRSWCHSFTAHEVMKRIKISLSTKGK